MKELKVGYVELAEYGVVVKEYLTLAEVQAIANAVAVMKTWAEKEQNIDMLLLNFATDIEKEKLEEVGHMTLHGCGLVKAVKEKVVNFGDIEKAIKHATSVEKLVDKYIKAFEKKTQEFAKNMPDMLKPLQKVVDKHASSKEQSATGSVAPTVN